MAQGIAKGVGGSRAAAGPGAQPESEATPAITDGNLGPAGSAPLSLDRSDLLLPLRRAAQAQHQPAQRRLRQRDSEVQEMNRQTGGERLVGRPSQQGQPGRPPDLHRAEADQTLDWNGQQQRADAKGKPN